MEIKEIGKEVIPACWSFGLYFCGPANGGRYPVKGFGLLTASSFTNTAFYDRLELCSPVIHRRYVPMLAMYTGLDLIFVLRSHRFVWLLWRLHRCDKQQNEKCGHFKIPGQMRSGNRNWEASYTSKMRSDRMTAHPSAFNRPAEVVLGPCLYYAKSTPLKPRFIGCD